jgi:hypothetical protein
MCGGIDLSESVESFFHSLGLKPDNPTVPVLRDIAEGLCSDTQFSACADVVLDESSAWDVVPGSIVRSLPLNPVCYRDIQAGLKLSTAAVDMSLIDIVISDGHFTIVEALCNPVASGTIVSASGAGKTKAVCDYLKTTLGLYFDCSRHQDVLHLGTLQRLEANRSLDDLTQFAMRNIAAIVAVRLMALVLFRAYCLAKGQPAERIPLLWLRFQLDGAPICCNTVALRIQNDVDKMRTAPLFFLQLVQMAVNAHIGKTFDARMLVVFDEAQSLLQRSMFPSASAKDSEASTSSLPSVSCGYLGCFIPTPLVDLVCVTVL